MCRRWHQPAGRCALNCRGTSSPAHQVHRLPLVCNLCENREQQSKLHFSHLAVSVRLVLWWRACLQAADDLRVGGVRGCGAHDGGGVHGLSKAARPAHRVLIHQRPPHELLHIHRSFMGRADDVRLSPAGNRLPHANGAWQRHSGQHTWGLLQLKGSWWCAQAGQQTLRGRVDRRRGAARCARDRTTCRSSSSSGAQCQGPPPPGCP